MKLKLSMTIKSNNMKNSPSNKKITSKLLVYKSIRPKQKTKEWNNL